MEQMRGFVESFHSFRVIYVHTFNMLGHCINIVFILQKNHFINDICVIFELNYKIVQSALDCPF